jgi:hypothetical protein
VDSPPPGSNDAQLHGTVTSTRLAIENASGQPVEVVPLEAEGLADRQDDIRGAIEAGSQTVANSIESLPSPPGWRLSEVSAKFGITLTAEAGVIVSRASAGATFEVPVKFTRG